MQRLILDGQGANNEFSTPHQDFTARKQKLEEKKAEARPKREAARQRAGRAGRTKEGMAYRMCTQGGFHEQLLKRSVPAVKEGDMLSEYLDILTMGRSPLTFPYIVAPARETIMKALGWAAAPRSLEKENLRAEKNWINDVYRQRKEKL